MSFPDLDADRRTNESFRVRTQPSHHKERSPFETLPIDMILSFPVSDPLHHLELGILRKCMHRWHFGTKSYRGKWGKHLSGLASRLLQKCQKEMPRDIHRAVRTLETIRYWKGLEFRTALLYIGCTVFKQVKSFFKLQHVYTQVIKMQIYDPLCNNFVQNA